MGIRSPEGQLHQNRTDLGNYSGKGFYTTGNGWTHDGRPKDGPSDVQTEQRQSGGHSRVQQSDRHDPGTTKTI